ncbi:MAG: hypothetical protein JXR84_06340 [Anaerolineae bacterium]|nr:hypothetical protein [Anaerolineae bacterium]
MLITGNSGAAGFFRQVVLRKHTPFAGTGSGLSHADCPECHGAGVVLDSRGVHAVRCPVCQPGKGWWHKMSRKENLHIIAFYVKL